MTRTIIIKDFNLNFITLKIKAIVYVIAAIIKVFSIQAIENIVVKYLKNFAVMFISFETVVIANYISNFSI